MFLGTQNINAVKISDQNITKIYRGSDIVMGESGYDVFLIAGQSNAYHGEVDTGDTVPDPTLDTSDADILQVGRWDGSNNTVILAEEPLDNIGYLGVRPDADTVAWSLTFAKMYKAQGYLHGDRKIILVPVAEGGSGFADGKWNKGDVNYEDAVARVGVAMAEGAGVNVVKGILWHQGEDDSGDVTRATAHGPALLQMIDDFRTDLGNASLPFIAGGLMPSYLTIASAQQVNDNIEAIATSRTYTGYADPVLPTELTVSVASGNLNHFSVTSHRGSVHDFNDVDSLGFAGRYWTAYLSALTNI